MKQEDNPPKRKYFKPDATEDSLSLCNEASIYTAKDCNSIERYMDIRSELEISKVPPKTLNNNIKEYSEQIGPDAYSLGLKPP